MVSYIKASWWKIKGLSETERAKLKRRLTLYSIDGTQIVKAYIERKDMLLVPRYALDDTPSNFIDETTHGSAIDIKMKSKYRYRGDHQKEAVNAVLANESGIVAARVGFGKTFVAIKAITRMKRKTLIVVHKKSLMNQWKEKIVEYTNLTEDDIGIIQGDNFEVDKPIVIAMIQTLLSKLKNPNYSDLFKAMRDANFGITFFDECHITVGPGAFLNVTKLIYSYRIYGLSATPTRIDGFAKIIFLSLGDVIFKYTDIDLFLNIVLLDMPIEIPNKTYTYILWGGRFNKQRYLKYLVNHTPFMDHLYSVLEFLVENKKFHALFLAERRDILDTLYKRINSLDVGLFYAGKDSSEMDKRIILSTTQMFKEGIDVPRLNTLVFSTPIGSKVSVKQALGRIMRQHKNKSDVYIIDINNSSFKISKYLLRNRYKIYNEYKNKKFHKVLITDDQDPKDVLESVLI